MIKEQRYEIPWYIKPLLWFRPKVAKMSAGAGETLYISRYYCKYLFGKPYRLYEITFSLDNFLKKTLPKIRIIKTTEGYYADLILKNKPPAGAAPERTTPAEAVGDVLLFYAQQIAIEQIGMEFECFDYTQGKIAQLADFYNIENTLALKMPPDQAAHHSAGIEQH
jgi:hypothetical protein